MKSDSELIREAVRLKRMGSDDPIGIVMISSRVVCMKCGLRLYVRQDRSSKVVLYDDTLGTILSTHYTKYCRKKGCSFQQHYGYSTVGHADEMTYDSDWFSLPYFMCTRETAISMDMLYRLDKEILIGQVSYKQRSDIYNEIHGYNTNRSVQLLAFYIILCMFVSNDGVTCLYSCILFHEPNKKQNRAARPPT